jgi:4-amino-4-deoxy-L-arabinose transferase-like glycosyltransferase
VIDKSRFGRAEWMCVGAALALRLVSIWIAARGAMPWIDPDSYLDRAAALAGGQWSWLRALTEDGGLTRPPLYSGALALVIHARWAPGAALVAQAILGAVTVALVILLARRLSSRVPALVAGWAIAISPAWLLAAPAFWSEHLYVPLVAAALLLLLTALSDNRIVTWLAAGVLFAAAALTRSMPLYLVPILVAILLVRGRPEGLPYAHSRSVWRGPLAMFVVFVMGCGAYIALVSDARGRLVLIENTAEWHWTARTRPVAAGAAPLSSVVPAMLRAARSSPMLLVREAASHVRVTFSPGVWNAETAEQFQPGLLATLRLVEVAWLVAVLALAGIGIAKHRHRTDVLLLAAWILVQLVLIALSSTNAGPRYRAPLDPALAALAAAALARI